MVNDPGPKLTDRLRRAGRVIGQIRGGAERLSAGMKEGYAESKPKPVPRSRATEKIVYIQERPKKKQKRVKVVYVQGPPSKAKKHRRGSDWDRIFG